MGRCILMFLFMLVSLQARPAKHLFIVNQNSPLFIREAEDWENWFVETYPDINVYRLTEYKVQEAGSIAENLGNFLSDEDTLFVVIATHGFTIENDPVNRGASILYDPAPEFPNLNTDVIFSYTWQFWIKYWDRKKIRTVIITTCCIPERVISRQFASTLKHTTVVMSTNKQYSQQWPWGTSVFCHLFTDIQNQDSTLSGKVRYVEQYMTKKRTVFYRDERIFPTKEDTTTWADLYPISPILIGKDFKF